MTVRNEGKKAFRDMTKEERGEIVEAWVAGRLEYYNVPCGEWRQKRHESTLTLDSAYRTRPRQLVIPWEVIRPEYKWAAMDKDGNVYVYFDKPHGQNGKWHNSKTYCGIMALNIDTTGIDWRDSLTERPEGV